MDYNFNPTRNAAVDVINYGQRLPGCGRIDAMGEYASPDIALTMYSFGSGTLIAKRTDVLNLPTALLAVTESFSIEMDQEIVELVGQNKIAVDTAPAELKITGKVKFARIQASSINNTILGQTQTSASGLKVNGPENHSAIPATTFTVTNGATFLEDFGIYYHGTGIGLQPTTATPGVGFYIAGVAATGTYTINAGDEAVSGGLDVFYTSTLATEQQIVVSQTLMGAGPVYEMVGSVPYAVQGVNKTFAFKLNACRCKKMPFMFANKKYMVPEMDYQAFADASGNVMTYSITE